MDTQYINVLSNTGNGIADQTKFKAFIQRCVDQPDVKYYMKGSLWKRKPVYVITGLKVVKGVQCSTTKSRSTEGSLSAQADLTIPSGGTVPITAGAGVLGGKKRTFKMSWKEQPEFVLAFKVSKVETDSKGQVTSIEEYRDGATLGLSGPTDEEDAFAIVQQSDIEEENKFVVLEGKDRVTYAFADESEEEEEDDDGVALEFD